MIEATEQAMEASIGASGTTNAESAESGFEAGRVANYLEENARSISDATVPSPADAVSQEIAARLKALAVGVRSDPAMALEELDRTLTVLEEKLFAGLLTATSEETLTSLREQASRELAPYRGKMQAVQIKQVQQQFLQKRLLEAHNLPRLSLFYMRLD